jgi:hypothetical protein
MEATNRQNTLAETEWQFVNATMVQAKTSVQGRYGQSQQWCEAKNVNATVARAKAACP